MHQPRHLTHQRLICQILTDDEADADYEDAQAAALGRAAAAKATAEAEAAATAAQPGGSLSGSRAVGMPGGAAHVIGGSRVHVYVILQCLSPLCNICLVWNCHGC